MGQRSAINAYLRYQTAKRIRRTLTGRLVLFVLGVGILSVGLHYLSVIAFVVTALLAGGMLAVALMHELKARTHLLHELNRR